MKLLHIQAQLPSRTGSGVYFSNVIKGLAAEHEQACVFGCYENYEADLPSDVKKYPLVFPNQSCCFHLPGMSDVMPYPTTIYGEMTDEMIQNWQKTFEQVITQAYEEFQPDIIVCHHLWFLTSLVCRMFPEKNIWAFCHGTDIRQAEQHPHLLQGYVKDLDQLTGVFALSQLQLEEIERIYKIEKQKITVAGGGFDETIFYPPVEKKAKDKIQLVYAGKISKAKGIFQLVEVFDEICSVKNNISLSIIGVANEEAQTFMTPYLLKNPQLHLYNVANQVLLAEELRKGDIFILPSYFEGLGLVAIESLACGMRTVTTEIPALKAQLGETINQSGLIEYVKLPRLFNQDEPYSEDLPEFRSNLKQGIIKQIERVEKQETAAENLQQEIMKSSWRELIKGIENRLISSYKLKGRS
ncbi:glycosyltransferase family 4 protein [Vagococcus elongatus]|uniref:Glycosyl transferase family 1 n=1 Tax=Vagococcus elongatus TaxID=180344 RepID=A0A430B1V9_9ENTE|nr:glycosyltransferase family 4 protein [Vagococcus elongatus]RSU14314.1 glycosyl transferase family 1 [Vagococcus elongatus]